MGLGAGGRGDSRGNVVRHAAAEGFRSWQRAEGPAGQTGTLGWGGPALWAGPAPGGQGAWPCSSPAGRLADILGGGHRDFPEEAEATLSWGDSAVSVPGKILRENPRRTDPGLSHLGCGHQGRGQSREVLRSGCWEHRDELAAWCRGPSAAPQAGLPRRQTFISSSLEAGSRSSRCGHSWLLRRPLSWARRWLSLRVLTRSSLCVCLCCKDTGPWDQGSPE